MYVVEYQSKDLEKLKASHDYMHQSLVNEHGEIEGDGNVQLTYIKEAEDNNRYAVILAQNNTAANGTSVINLDELPSGFIKDTGRDVLADFGIEE